MKVITEAGDLKGKRVLVRVDWNVPIEGGVVTDDFRIRQSMPTLDYLLGAGAKVVIMTHLDPDTASVKPLRSFVPKGVLLLENLRNNPGEKANSEEFAKELATKGDIYVNEAFSVSHRAHASLVSVPKFLPSFAGIRFMQEIEGLSKAFNPEHPFVFILGGAKFDTKLPLLQKFKDKADTMFVGGALAHNFFKEEGLEIGESLVSEGNFDLKTLLDTGKCMLPSDVVVSGGETDIKQANEVALGEKIVDAGPESTLKLREKVLGAKMILWNGPMGLYEEGYREGTHDVARLLAESGAQTIVGGADTLAAIKELEIEDKFTFVSTAGGAMLDFLANETLPGIEALG